MCVFQECSRQRDVLMKTRLCGHDAVVKKASLLLYFCIMEKIKELQAKDRESALRRLDKLRFIIMSQS